MRQKQEETTQITQAVQSYFQSDVAACKAIGRGGAGIVYKLTFSNGAPPVCVKQYTSAGLGERQKSDMEFLSQYSKIPFPHVYFVHNATPQIPLNLLCMEYLPGVSAFNKTFYWKSKKKRAALAEQVIDNLIGIHQVKNDLFGDLDRPSFPTWNAYYKPKAQSILAQAQQDTAQGKFSPNVLSAMQTAFYAYDQIFFEEVTSASLIHGDFFAANILVDPKSFTPVAIIDPFNSMWADVEYELFALNNVMGRCFRFYETYKNKVAVSKMCDVKCAFYALFAEVLWYQLYGCKSDAFIDGLVKKLQIQLKKFHIRP